MTPEQAMVDMMALRNPAFIIPTIPEIQDDEDYNQIT